MSLICQISIVVIAGILSLRGVIKVGAIITVSNLGGTIFGSLTALSFCIVGISATKPVFQKFHDFGDKASSNFSDDENEQSLNVGPTDSIELKHLSYGARKSQTKILTDLNIKFEMGKKYAIVAPSGYGKSTLLNLIFGLIPATAGSYTVDGTDFENVKTKTQANMTYVDQTPYIFAGTVRKNILLDREATELELEQAVRISGVADFIADLPAGLDTVLQHGGPNLSGGQRQRVTLARMLLKEKPVILLDEATSALDRHEAVKVEKNILSQSDKTVIFVTHQLKDEVLGYVDSVVDLTEINHVAS